MTSAVGGGGGSSKSREKEQGCVNSVRDQGVQKSEIYVIYGSPLNLRLTLDNSRSMAARSRCRNKRGGRRGP